ncbi:MAG: UDP-3-O-(3-hydroxymyristoyl)glucosamine N-acyltransferase [bacterium]
MPRFNLSEITCLLGGELSGDPDREITGISGLDEAGENDISFLANPRYVAKLPGTRAGAVIVSKEVSLSGKNLILVENPYAAFGQTLKLFDTYEPATGVSDQAIISGDAVMGKGVTVYPGAYIGCRVKLGDRARVYPGAVIDDDVTIGDDSIIYHNVSLYHGCVLGSRVSVHAGSVIGGDGFGYVQVGEISRKIPQIGRVRIGDDVEIGAGVTIDRGTMGETVIESGVKIDNLVQIAHNVRIGKNSIIVAQVGISGSTRLGERVVLGGQAGLVGHLNVGDGAQVAAKGGVTKDVPPGAVIGGTEGLPINDWKRQVAATRRLPATIKAIRKLAEEVEELHQRLAALENRL